MNTWVIPMAGKGIRTQSLGEFKPFIKINNYEILFWFLFSIKHLIKKRDKIIFITTIYFAKKFEVQKKINKLLQDLKIKNKFYLIETPNDTAGQSISIKFAKNIINQNKPLIVINPDQYVDFNLPEKITHCYLPLYVQLGNKSGFVSIENKKITNFVEKNNISNLACAGIFIIAKAKWLFSGIKEQIKNKDMLNGEFYLGPVFNYIIKKGLTVEPLMLRAKYDLGNPEDAKIFERNNISRSL